MQNCLWRSIQSGHPIRLLFCYAIYDMTHRAGRAAGTNYGQTRIHRADYSLRHQRDGRAGNTVTILYHLRNYSGTHSL
jgi:hypothetical protein